MHVCMNVYISLYMYACMCLCACMYTMHLSMHAYMSKFSSQQTSWLNKWAASRHNVLPIHRDRPKLQKSSCTLNGPTTKLYHLQETLKLAPVGRAGHVRTRKCDPRQRTNNLLIF